MIAPHGYAAIVALYGDPKFSGSQDAHVDPTWESDHMVLVHDFPAMPLRDDSTPRALYCHWLIVDPLRAALVVADRMGWRAKTAGCFSPRQQRGATSRVSIHTFGAAVDFDADDNPLIVSCPVGDPRRAAAGAKTIPEEVVQAFRDQGFLWGGDFATRFDPMHFQLATGY